MLNNPKAWWTLLFIQCTMVALVLGAYFGMKTNILSMKHELRVMSIRVTALEEKLNPTLPSSTNPVGSATQPASRDRVGTASDPADSDAGSERQSPICVNKMTHLVISCALASKCLGGNNFDGEYFKKIRQKVGLAESDVMLICEERTIEDAAPTPEPRSSHSKSAPTTRSEAKQAPEVRLPPSTASQEYGL